MSKKIAIGADHGGFDLKTEIIPLLKEKGYRIYDVGTCSDESCDYPIFGSGAASLVSKKKVSKGILICKSGIGMSIVANKFPGVRAALVFTESEAKSSREHNDANVLVLSGNKISPKKAAGIIKVWLETKALGDRHKRRVREILDLEKKLYK